MKVNYLPLKGIFKKVTEQGILGPPSSNGLGPLSSYFWDHFLKLSSEYVKKHFGDVLTDMFVELYSLRPTKPVLWLADALRQHSRNEKARKALEAKPVEEVKPEVQPEVEEEFCNPDENEKVLLKKVFGKKFAADKKRKLSENTSEK